MRNVHYIESSQYSQNLSEMVKDLYEHKQFSDVTLISEDHRQVPAHKFILSSCSSFFAKILVNLNQPNTARINWSKGMIEYTNTAIYLRGLQAKEMDYLLQYCYLGRVRMPYDYITEFMALLKEFDVWNSENVENKNEVQKTEKTENDYIGDVCETIVKEETSLLNKSLTEEKVPIDETLQEESNEENPEACNEDFPGKIDWSEVEVDENLENDLDATPKDEIESKEGLPDNVDSEDTKIKKLPLSQKTKRPYNRKGRPLSEKRNLTCDTCGYISTRYSYLQQHKNVVHLGIKNSLPCDICGKTLGGKQALLLHIRSIHDKIAYNCDVENCTYSVKTFGALNQHKKYIHEGKEYFCDICPKKFTRRHKLKKHISLIHSDAPMLLCEKCDYKTKYKERLKKHMTIHNGLKVSCDLCDFKTVWTSNLNDHRKKVHKQPIQLSLH